jgi:hypothetical protein
MSNSKIGATMQQGMKSVQANFIHVRPSPVASFFLPYGSKIHSKGVEL